MSLLKGNIVKVVKPFDNFKKGDLLTIQNIGGLVSDKGAAITFEESDKFYTLSIYDDGYIIPKKLTEKQIRNWFKKHD